MTGDLGRSSIRVLDEISINIFAVAKVSFSFRRKDINFIRITQLQLESIDWEHEKFRVKTPSVTIFVLSKQPTYKLTSIFRTLLIYSQQPRTLSNKISPNVHQR